MKDERLDILLYAHDGRGLGHAARTIAIGMALRRRYPDLRILLVTGCRHSQELIDEAALDWLKLPSYETRVQSGVSRGIPGRSNFADQTLARLRSLELVHLHDLYRPRVILCDHSPLGKHRELLPLLEIARSKMVLGLRGVVGEVGQVVSVEAQAVFQRHFHGLLWYGDSSVLGRNHVRAVERQFGMPALECGYVSRLLELRRIIELQDEEMGFTCTVSIPWIGEHTIPAVQVLSRSLAALGDQASWEIYLGDPDSLEQRRALTAALSPLPRYCVRPFGREYARSLARSRFAVIYGGYNSIVDVMTCRIPALVILRAMADREQQQHLARLAASGISGLYAIEEADAERLGNLGPMLADASAAESFPAGVDIEGAQNAADRLAAWC